MTLHVAEINDKVGGKRENYGSHQNRNTYSVLKYRGQSVHVEEPND